MNINSTHFTCNLKTNFYSHRINYDFPTINMNPNISGNDICIHHYLQRDSKKHNHNFIELAYIADGEIAHIVNDKKFLLHTGDYVFLNYGDIHQYKILSGDTADIINLCFIPRFINTLLTESTDLYECLEAYPISFFKNMLKEPLSYHVFSDNDGKIRCLLDDMLSEYNSDDFQSKEIIRTDLTKLLILSLRTVTKDACAIKDELVMNVIQYIESNLFSSELSSNEISDKFRVSRQYISRRFKEITGMTFTSYVKKMKINHCCRLLCTSDYSVAEISEAVGYKDMKTFYHDFRRFTGTVPLEFKKNAKM